MTDKIKECKTHGKTNYVLRRDGRYRCRKCASEAVSKRRRKVKEMAVEYLGNKCSKCNYNKCTAALEFHHKDGGKDFGIAQKGATRAWSKIKIELDKCVLLCANCHREEHWL